MRKLWFVVVAAILALSLPSTAYANWGNNCGPKVEHHCYAIAYWEMSGSGHGGGEEVLGLQAWIDTTAMLVPGWQEGFFVDNEMWMSGPGGGWMEDGQTTGNGYNATSLQPFWAYSIGSPAEYKEWVAPWTVSASAWHSYKIQDPGTNGIWCATLETETAECKGYFTPYATTVEIGMEAATSAAPENQGADQTAVEWTDGTWHSWNRAGETVINNLNESEAGYICVKKTESAPGYVRWGTPASKYPC